MEAPFKVGQEVVCVERYSFTDLVIGRHYSVRGILSCLCGWVVMVDDGPETFCEICSTFFPGGYRDYTCFAPIESRPERIKYVAVSEKVREKPVEVANSLRETAVEIAAVETN